jgi:hypothetical protein
MGIQERSASTHCHAGLVAAALLLAWKAPVSELSGHCCLLVRRIHVLAWQEAQMTVEQSMFSDDGLRHEQLPSEQELLEGMQAVQDAVAAAEREHGILSSPQPVRHADSREQSGEFPLLRPALRMSQMSTGFKLSASAQGE